MSIQRALASASFALNALTYTLIDGMTLTPGKAPGGYLAFFSMDQTFADPVSGAAFLRTQIFENGVGIDHSVRRLDADNSIDAAQIPILGSAFVDPEDGETVEVRYLELPAFGGLYIFGDLHNLVVIEVQAGYRVV